jgi:phosphatidylserine/phosphatidylglycerophosphate/cardiolipin synthase-like enzyme
MRHARFSALPLLALLLAAAAASCAKPEVVPCYTPGGRCSDAIVGEIGAARSEVLVQAYALTSKPVMDALVQARESGVNVTVILDPTYPFAQNSALYLSSLKGVPTFIDSRHPLAGNNVIIIDSATVITGSMPFTQDAEERQAENIVLIRSSGVAGSYRENWSAHKEHSEAFVKPPEQPVKEEPAPKPKPEKKSAKSKKKKKSP